ncbi:MAG: radical SAM protein [Myxococcales bacterium]|nr:radical SAM protein [Myxococcales bacterium]
MKIISESGDKNLAEVFVAKFRGDEKFLAEFVDAKDPTMPRNKKWVMILSTQFGCPVKCPMCDSGGNYHGDLSADEILSQVRHILSRYPDEFANSCEKLKIQFARMGEPALNNSVLEALRALPSLVAPKLMIPCVATTAPAASKRWFEELLEIKNELYSEHLFQIQFSINSTDPAQRDHMMPIAKMSFDEISKFGKRFVRRGERKAALNFTTVKGLDYDADVIARHFSPEHFCVKMTPLNPTESADEAGLRSSFEEIAEPFAEKLTGHGFDVILSIGDLKENEIGSNCGQSVRRLHKSI